MSHRLSAAAAVAALSAAMLGVLVLHQGDSSPSSRHRTETVQHGSSDSYVIRTK